jgi:hypothetical protein
LHDRYSSLKTVCTSIGPLDRITNLVPKRLLKQVTRESGTLSPRPKGRPQSMGGYGTATLRIDPAMIARVIAIQFLQLGRRGVST